MQSTTVNAINGFQELVGRYKVVTKNSCEKILETIDRVRLTKPNAYHQKHIASFLEERAKVLNTLADDYLKTYIGAKYPLIDPALWTLKRNLLLKKGDGGPVVIRDEAESIPAPLPEGTKVISTPLFAWVNLSNKETVCQLFKGDVYIDTTYKVEISAEMPGMLGGNLRRAYREALAYAYQAASELLYKDGVGDVLSENLDNLKSDVLVAWIPTIASLKIKSEVVHPPVKYDPAMFVRMRGQCFLVAMWAVDDELPLEHFIREYSHGSLEKVVKE